MTSVGFAQQNDRAAMTEIPVTRLRVAFEFQANDVRGLDLLKLVTTAGFAESAIEITALTEALPPPAAPSEDWSKLVPPRLWLQRGRLTEILHLEGAVQALDRAFEKAREAARDLGPTTASLPEYHGPIPPSQASPLTPPGAFDDDKLEVRYPDPLPSPPAASAGPTKPQARDPATLQKAIRGQERPLRSSEAPVRRKPAAPKSRAEALVMMANVTQDIAKAAPVGKTVPVTPQIPAGPTKMGLRQRLIEKLRALYRSGEPIPGNKELGAELGASKDHIGVALAELKRIEAINYEWRPAPTLEDETLQRRFVTKA